MSRWWLQRALVCLARNLTKGNAKQFVLSNAILKCGIHPCPQRCHQLYDHSKMKCQHVLRSKCPDGHIMSWECYSRGPATCATCLLKKEADEKKQKEEFKRQQKLERHRQGHAAKMAQLDEEIRQVKERTLEAQLSRDMKLALEQKQRDLENMKTLAAQSLNGSTKSANAVMSLPHHKSSLPERNRASASAPSSAAQVERTFDPDIQEEQVQSPSEKEWDRQKQQENVSSDAIDSLMAMTGLEQVKAQFLRIKAKIETALRQSTKLNKERFGIVLLGNPGTG
jgi:hypothetical protein